MRRFLGAAGVAAMLSACGGSGSGGGDGSGPDTVEGVFVDSPVTGLEFVGEQGRGFTGDDGGFTAAGVVAFLIGDIELGSAPAAAFLTPVDLVPGAGAGDDPAANRIVTNIIRLLQTLDADGNPANGIRISEDALAAGAGRTLVFDQPVEDFAADPDVQAYLCAALSPEGPCDEPVDLVPVEAAREHLRATLDHIAEHGAPNRLPIADAGDDQAVASGDAVTLDGGASTDPDPRPETPDPIVAWHWRQTAGPVVELAEGENPALRSFTPQVADDAELVFELTVTDDDGGQASDTVTVAVAGTGGGGNTPPVAEAGSFSLLADRTLVERVAASDPDGDDLELSVVEEPVNGSLDLAADGRFTYVPDAGFTGTDTFAFQASDGAAVSEPAQVAIELRPIPVARLLAGAAKRTVTPQQRHIDGVAEPRLGGSETLQQFHLGGFDTDPLQNFPDPLRQRFTDPAGERVLETAAGPEDTWVRVLVLSLRDADGNDTEVVFVSLDAVGAGNVIQAGLKAAVHTATGLPEDNILFGQTHSHAGADLQGLWGGVPQEWIDDPLEGDGLYQLAAAAAVEAYARQRPAALSVAQTSLPELNNYRRPAVHGDEDADTTATLLQARDDDGALLASLLQYNAHPTVVGTGAHDGVEGLGARVPHADYVLGAVENLETDGGVALYYNGPIADASSSGPGGANDYDKARNRGSAIADGARGGEPRMLADSLSVRHAEAVLPVTNPLFVSAAALGSFNRYYDFVQIPFADIPGLGGILAGEAGNLPQSAPVARTLVSRVTLGGPDGLEIVTIPGEATNTFGGYIKHLAGGTEVMLLGLTQNSFGYIIPEDEFNYVSETGDTGFALPFTNYEEYVSLGPFTAPLLRLQAYNPLFDAPADANLPPSLAACLGIDSGDACILTDLAARPGWYQREYGKTCRENLGEDQAFCGLIDPVPAASSPPPAARRARPRTSAGCWSWARDPAAAIRPRRTRSWPRPPPRPACAAATCSIRRIA